MNCGACAMVALCLESWLIHNWACSALTMASILSIDCRDWSALKLKLGTRRAAKFSAK
jgi:hypothetical protein